MRTQSEDGAQWIPTRLLRIMPGHMIKTTLGAAHTKLMIQNTLRMPAENPGLIEQECLGIIGVKPARDGGEQPLVSEPLDRLLRVADVVTEICGLRN